MKRAALNCGGICVWHTNGLSGSNLAHAKQVTYEKVQREATLRLHRANEKIILHLQEAGEEFEDFQDFFHDDNQRENVEDTNDAQ